MQARALKLVCFSPTGTTRAVAQALAQGIAAGPVELVDITRPGARLRRLEAGRDDVLLVAVPVYVGRVPELARDWLRTITLRATPSVCLVVYGNRAVDDALLELTDIIREGGGDPVAGATFVGEHSFSRAGTPIAAGRPDAEDLERASRFGGAVRDKLRGLGPQGSTSRLVVPGTRPYRQRLPRPPAPSIAVDESCVACGSCAEVCPVGAIDHLGRSAGEDGGCVLCCACVKCCPEGARRLRAPWLRDLAARLSATCSVRKEPELFL